MHISSPKFLAVGSFRLAATALIGLASLAAVPAHADSFSTSSSDALRAMVKRVETLEGQLSSMSTQLAAQQAALADAKSAKPNLNLPEPPEYSGFTNDGLDILAEPTYTVVGEMNGNTMVRSGGKLLVLNKQEFKDFRNLEIAKARKKQGLDTTSGMAATMPPPPTTGALSQLTAEPPSAPPEVAMPKKTVTKRTATRNAKSTTK